MTSKHCSLCSLWLCSPTHWINERICPSNIPSINLQPMNARNNGKSISMPSLCSNDGTIPILEALHSTSSIGFSTDLGSLNQIKRLMTHIPVSLRHLQPNWVERWSHTNSPQKKTNIVGCALLKNSNTKCRRQFFVLMVCKTPTTMLK